MNETSISEPTRTFGELCTPIGGVRGHNEEIALPPAKPPTHSFGAHLEVPSTARRQEQAVDASDVMRPQRLDEGFSLDSNRRPETPSKTTFPTGCLDAATGRMNGHSASRETPPQVRNEPGGDVRANKTYERIAFGVPPTTGTHSHRGARQW